MDMFFLRSKKTSESGVWVNDEEVTNCYCCGAGFTLLLRKHHCRQCGQVVCGPCSENRTFLESSRSGSLKRICDKCYNKERGIGDDDEEADEAAKAVAKMGLGDDTAAGSASGAAAIAPTARVAPTNDEAVQALKDYPFSGPWQVRLFFNMVDLVRPGEVAAAGLATAFKGPAGKAGRRSMAPEGPLRAGSQMRVNIELETKGAAYFKGTTGDFGQFGKEGKVNGAVQRMTGKVNMTVQVVHMKTTMSFNFVGMRLEMSGSEDEEDEEESDGAAKKKSSSKRSSKKPADDDDDDDSPSRSARSAAKKSGSKKVADSEDDESEEEPKAKPKKKPAKKAASDDDDDEEEVKPKKASKKPARKAASDDDDEEEEVKPKKSSKKPARKAASDDDESS